MAFVNELKRGQKKEEEMIDILFQLTDDYNFELITDLKEQHKGDIRATNFKTGEVHYIEVKSVKNGDLFVEVEKEYPDYKRTGWIASPYEIIAYTYDNWCYIVDFEALKKGYTQGRKDTLYQYDSVNTGYWMSTKVLKEIGALRHMFCCKPEALNALMHKRLTAYQIEASKALRNFNKNY